MIPTPKHYEVNALTTQAIDLQRKENITMLEAIETVCVQSPVPTTDEPLSLGNVQAYQHRLQDAVTTEIYRRIYHATDAAVIADYSDEELEVLRCNLINEQEDRIQAAFQADNPSEDAYPYTDAVDDQDGTSELPPFVPEDRDS